jgi:hypothetical protein
MISDLFSANAQHGGNELRGPQCVLKPRNKGQDIALNSSNIGTVE